jgi:hypothetical protein
MGIDISKKPVFFVAIRPVSPSSHNVPLSFVAVVGQDGPICRNILANI